MAMARLVEFVTHCANRSDRWLTSRASSFPNVLNPESMHESLLVWARTNNLPTFGTAGFGSMRSNTVRMELKTNPMHANHVSRETFRQWKGNRADWLINDVRTGKLIFDVWVGTNRVGSADLSAD